MYFQCTTFMKKKKVGVVFFFNMFTNSLTFSLKGGMEFQSPWRLDLVKRIKQKWLCDFWDKVIKGILLSWIPLLWGKPDVMFEDTKAALWGGSKWWAIEPLANSHVSQPLWKWIQPQSILQMRPQPCKHLGYNFRSQNYPTKLLPNSWCRETVNNKRLLF